MRSGGTHPCIVVLLVAGAARGEAAKVDSAVEGPWDLSVKLEQAGDLRNAEAVVVAAWGKKPNDFYAQLRLAHLALSAKRAKAAVARYRRALRFPEAEGDADVVAGYAAALALKGWQLADAGRPSEARACWREALAVKPDQPDALAGLSNAAAPVAEPEAWGAIMGESFGSGRYQGLAAFVQLPWRFFDWLTLRVAGRHIAWRQISRPSPWAFPGPSSTSWTVDEIYAGAGYDTRVVTAELLGFAVIAAGSPTILGTGLRLRAGRRWGAFADIAAMRIDGSDGHWVNEQARPAVFLAIGARLLLHAGARLTHEPTGLSTSGVAGASWVDSRISVYLQGHFGAEHWAADLTSPSILSITPGTRSGGTVTLVWNATRALRVAGQAEACALSADGATGSFWSVSLGLQWRIFDL